MNLSRKSYALAVLIVLLGILSTWGVDYLGPVWRILAAALLLGLVIEGFLARSLRPEISRELPAAATLGQALHYQLRVFNPLDLPLRIHSMESLPGLAAGTPEVMQWNVASGASQTQTTRLTPVRLGTLSWGPLHLRVRGRFGLAWWSLRLPLPDQCPIVPDRLDSSEYKKAATELQGDINRRSTGTGHELLGLREYRPGDPLHWVDWKATARSRKTMIRLFSDEQRLELFLVIDAGRTSGMQAGNLTRLGHYSNVAARLAEKAMHHGDQVGLLVFADQIIHQHKGLRGHAGLQQLRRVLQQLQPVPRESNPLSAILQIRKLAGHRSLVVVFTDLDDGEAATQLVNAMRLLRPKHQPILAAIADDETMRLQHMPIEDWADPYYSLAASEMIHNWQHTRYQLQHLGVPVVFTSSRQLDSQVLSSYDRMKQQHRI